MLQLLVPTLALVAANCSDTPHWSNPFGKSCADYATPVPPSRQGRPEPHGFGLTGGWCEAGRLKEEARWAGGAAHGWPERHCCACGRGSVAPTEFDAGSLTPALVDLMAADMKRQVTGETVRHLGV